MTVSATPRIAGPYAGNGASILFPFAFKVFVPSDVRVTLTDTSGQETVLALGVHYLVELSLDQDNNPGGTVTYPVTGAALAAGQTLTITSAVPYHQPSDIQNQSGFYPRVIEDALDRGVIQTQQLIAEVQRISAIADSTFSQVVIVSTEPPSGGNDGDIWFQVI